VQHPDTGETERVGKFRVHPGERDFEERGIQAHDPSFTHGIRRVILHINPPWCLKSVLRVSV
jgi:hypothetical protein